MLYNISRNIYPTKPKLTRAARDKQTYL